MFSMDIFNLQRYNSKKKITKLWLFPRVQSLLFPWGKPILEADACTLQALAEHRALQSFCTLHSPSSCNSLTCLLLVP